MGEDRALDEFLGGDDDDGEQEGQSADVDDEADAGEGASEGAGAGADAEVNADGEPEADEAPRAVSTTAFEPEGAPCKACGATVRRRWRDDGALVCADCKAW